jgi:hypothetical protein
VGHVQPGDLLDAAELEQLGHQRARAAAEVQDASCPAGRDRRGHRRDPLVAQPDPGEPPVMPEVALRDQLPVGMPDEPLAAAAQELGDFIVAHPVMLVVVQHGKQDE